MNLVLDNVEEVTRGMFRKGNHGLLRMPRNHPLQLNNKTNISSDEEGNTSTRKLGLLVARGTLLVLISPVDGSEEIENPFVQGEDEE
jgi:small nuclear ribonucleoprotein (snRNP)-like protein